MYAGVVTTIAGRVTGYADGVGTSALFSLPVGITRDENEILYIADSNNKNIRVIFSSGKYATCAYAFHGLK